MEKIITRVIQGNLRISSSEYSELGNPTTKIDTAERIILIRRESLHAFWIIGAMAYLDVSQLRGNRDETRRGQMGKKVFCVLEFAKTESIVTVQRKFRPSTTQNHPRTKQFVSGTRNPSKVAACAMRNEQADRSHRPRLSNMCEKLLSGVLRRQHIARAGNCRCVSQVSGAFCANVFARKDTG
jgi:hypothetical protein